MTNKAAKTTERIDPEQWFSTRHEYLLYLRHLFAYEFARTLLKPEHTVLEVGSGEGYGSVLLARAAGRVIGLDIDAATVQHAAARYGSDRVAFQAYDGFRMPFPDSTFDVVVSFQVVEHVTDVLSYLTEIRRVLRPGGLFVLTTPNRLYRLRPGQRPWNRFHLREYDPAGLRTELAVVFPRVDVWGVRASDEVQAIEHARVAWGLRRGPTSALRRAMPEWTRRLVGDVLAPTKKRRAEGKPDFLTRYQLSDYFVIKDQPDHSLDLLAVCSK